MARKSRHIEMCSQAWRTVVEQDRGSKDLLSPEDMKRIVGPGAYDQHGKGNINVGDGGVAFLLASAGTIPGGAPLVSADAVVHMLCSDQTKHCHFHHNGCFCHVGKLPLQPKEP